MPKTNRVKLTQKRVSDFQGPGYLRDSEAAGLGVLANKAGKKYYIVERRFETGGSCPRLFIGPCSEWKLCDARVEAIRLVQLISQGIDPRKEKAKLKASQERDGLLVADVWQRYLTAHKTQWGERHMQDHSYTGTILKPLLEKHLGDINAKSLVRWADDAINAPLGSHRDKGQHTAVRQGFIKFRAFWRWACRREELGALADPAMFSHDELRALIPRAGIKNDVLQLSQLKDWFGAVTMIENRVISAFLQCLLITGARRNELAALRWADIDFKLKGIHLHDKIEVGGRMVPLTPYCEFLISSLPRRNEFVFSANSASGRLVEPRIAHKKALLIAGLSRDLSLHGLRRTFATVAQELEEMPAGVAAQLMGHKPSATAEKHYIKRSLDFLKKWHSRLEAMILAEAGIDFDPAKVKGGLQVAK